ncbi:glycosyltransferase [Candidatus Dojkabacteria bacterium]|nr:glycosyltransferase [Candidatus Dojkabacteria bacterium]
MKLIIHIPCYNEEKTLPLTYRDLPQKIDGIDQIEVLVTDDGSTDQTARVAKEIGVDYIIQNDVNKGLAATFRKGINACLERGADIIVNTDADNQYYGADIEKLVKPILEKKAEVVIGERPISEIKHFSFAKKILQKLGSWVVRVVSGTKVPDAPSGFRAYSREAAMRMNVISNFSYTLETVIQAGHNGFKIISVPIRTNPELRKSRLLKSIPSYVKKSASTILRIGAFYNPLQMFFLLGSVFFVTGLALSARVLVLALAYGHSFKEHLPSTVIGGSAVAIGIIIYVVGLLADVINHNRKLSEEILFRLKSHEFDGLTKDTKQE